MPEHTSWLTFLLAYMKDTLAKNASSIGNTVVGAHPPSWRSFEPVTAAGMVAILVIILAALARGRLAKHGAALAPEGKLTLSTFFEIFLGYFYDLAKGMMGPDRAKKYFPLIGTAATFVFFANAISLIPGAPVATSSLSVTLGLALVVFVLFNAYGLMENGWDYVSHLAGPAWYLAPLVFPIEVVGLCVRPVTLSVRLMLNMAVDHLLVGIIMGLVCVLVPVPLMVLGCLVIIVQTLVFTLLTTIYVALATEPMHHDDHDDHELEGAHGH